MQLIKDEVVVKEFQYAKVSRGGKEVSCSVTITNKRVFTTDATKRNIAHTEVPLSKVKRMDASFQAPNNWISIICIIYAVFALILTIACGAMGLFNEQPMIIGLMAIIILMGLAAAWLLWQWPTFKWTLSVVGIEGTPLYTSVAKLVPSRGRIGRIKVHLNRAVCEEFTYSIGAAIAEARILAEQDGQKAE
ncbi:MAG: hypothetical protein J6R29_05960 [Clostridia bacterium]|nr:hypothetical protein [Clostridia bacterium]